MRNLPETIALVVLVLVATTMVWQMAETAAQYSRWDRGNVFHRYWSHARRQELADHPPGLVRDLRFAGPAALPVLAAGAGLLAVAGRAVLRRRAAGARVAERIGLIALLAALALAAPTWSEMPPFRLSTAVRRLEPGASILTRGAAAVRLGLFAAILGHALALVLRGARAFGRTR